MPSRLTELYSQLLRKRSTSCFITIHTEVTYLEILKRKRNNDESDGEVDSLPHKKRGRPLLLESVLNEQLQLYLKKVLKEEVELQQVLHWLLPVDSCFPPTT